MRIYEAMFLMDPSLASDWPTAETEINRIIDRAQAKLLGVRSWGERKLAYPIGQWKRGLYALTYFESEPDSITTLERDVQLSEKAIRVLVVRRESMSLEAVEKALACEPPSKTPARSDEWGGRPSFGRPGSGRPDRGPDKGAGPEAREGAGKQPRTEGAGKESVKTKTASTGTASTATAPEPPKVSSPDAGDKTGPDEKAADGPQAAE